MPGSEEAIAHPEGGFPFAAARAALSFEGGARKLVRIYKDGDELRLGGVIASFLCAAMRGREQRDMLSQGTRPADLAGRPMGGPCAGGGEGLSRGPFSQGTRFMRLAGMGDGTEDWTQWADALAYVPASPEAVRRRGFDHMQRVATICAERVGLPLATGLEVRRRSLDQRELGRQGRIENKSGAFVAHCTGPAPARVIVIDDVMTTGATLSAATRALLDAGVDEVRVVVCCRVW